MTVQIKIRYERSPGGSRDTHTADAIDYGTGLLVAERMLRGCASSGWRVLRVTLEVVSHPEGAVA